MKLIEVYRQIVLPTKIGRSVKKILELSLDPSVYAKDLLPVFMENAALRNAVLKWDILQGKLTEWIEEAPNKRIDETVLLTRSLNLLGKQAIRNLVASHEVLRISGGLPRKVKDKYKLNPKELINYALISEEKSELSAGVLPEVAFLVGFHFDLLKASILRSKISREGTAQLEKDWGEWLKDAQFSVRLGSQLKKFEDGALVYSGALLSRTGEIIMRTIHGSDKGEASYREFLKKSIREDSIDLRRLFTEKKAFEILEREWAMLFIREIGLFPDLERICRYVEEPYFFHDGRDVVLSDVIFEGIINRKLDRANRRMSIDGGVFETIRKKSV